MIRDLSRALRLPWARLALPILLSSLASLSVLPAAVFIQRAVQRALDGEPAGRVVAAAAISFLLQLGATVLLLIARGRVLVELKGSVRDLRARLLQHELTRPLSEVRAGDPAGMGSLIVTDVEQLDVLSDQLFGSTLPAVVSLAAAFVFLCQADLVLTGVVATIGIPMVAAGRLAARQTWRTSSRYWSAYHHATARLLRLRRAQEAIVEAGAEGRAAAAEGPTFDDLRTTATRMHATTAVGSQLQLTLIALGAAVLLVVGALRHRAEGGATLLAILFALAVAQASARTLVTSALHIAAGRNALARVTAELAAGSGAHPIGSVVDRISSVELQAVSVHYPDQGAAALPPVDLLLRTGDRVAVTGPNGAGKSTLLRVIAGSVVPSAGRVRVNGVPLAELDLRSVRRRIAFAGQRAVHVSGTCEENLRLFGADQPAAALEEVLDLVGLAVPLDRELGDEGLRLSGGQMQRLALARLLLHEPDVVLLDEPGNHLDEPLTDVLSRLLPRWPTAIWVVVTHDTRIARIEGMRRLELPGRATREAG